MANSAHPPGCFKGFKSQSMRIRRNCTNLSDHKLHIMKLINAYKERGYNELVLKQAATETEFSHCETLLTPKPRHTNDSTTPVCVLPYNKHNLNARTIILKNIGIF